MELDILVLVQSAAVALPAAWLSLGTLDNILHPGINRGDVARVLALEALRDWPDVRARVGHRAITNERTVRRVFLLVVTAECVASIVLWAGAVHLGLAFLGLADHERARDLAMIGALGFHGHLGIVPHRRAVVLLLVRFLRAIHPLHGHPLGAGHTDHPGPLGTGPQQSGS